MFHIYRKNGAWVLRGNEHLLATTEEEAINLAVKVGTEMNLQEFDILVEKPEPAFPSPYEQILGFQICDRCFLHPCEC
jgi:hypothetical protein